MTDLNGKVAFIANAGNAVGQACRAKLREAGARICAAGADEADLSVSIDPMDPDAWDKAYAQCIDELGGLDVLVIPTLGKISNSIDSESLEDFKETHRGMAVPAFLAQNRGVVSMRSAGQGGAIVHVIPAAARAALDGASAACTASAGILFSAKSASLECAKAKDGIVVNAILVGQLDGEHALPYGADATVIKPEEVADAVLFYATDGAVYMSGMDLPLDGGLLAQ